MQRKFVIVLLSIGLCLMGITPVLAQKIYPTLAEYEKLTGKSIEAFNEAPSLKTRVAAGEIPPLEERLPEEPLVVEPLDEIGPYGGVIRIAATGPTLGGAEVWSSRAHSLFRLAPDLVTIQPHIAKGWDWSDEVKTLTVHLRKGMKWNDGVPFTADDFIFYYENILLSDELIPVKPADWSPGGELVKIEKIDDYTVRFRFAVPYPGIVTRLGFESRGYRFIPFAPGHYLKKYHINYNPKANEIAKKEGFDSWWQCFNFHYPNEIQARYDPDLPVLNNWCLEEVDSYGNRYFERNPYFWAIDTAGNQLPYIDEQARMMIENKEIISLKAIGGELDVSTQFLSLENYPIYKKGEKKGDYRVLLFSSGQGSDCTFGFNLTCKDPVLRKIFNDVRLRQAMSLAVNREEMNEILYFGKGIPRQATAPPECSFYEDWMGKYYAEYDPEGANKLLDEMGLKRGKDGYRLRPDGKTLTIILQYAEMESRGGRWCQLVAEYWEKIGVKVALKEVTHSFYGKRGSANELEVPVWSYESGEIGMRGNRAGHFKPNWKSPGHSIEWSKWYNTGGKSGEEPPELIRDLFELCDEWATTIPGTEEYLRLGKQILTLNVKNLFLIGTVGMTPRPVIAKNNLRNFPQEGTWTGDGYRFWSPYHGEQWFFKK